MKSNVKIYNNSNLDTKVVGYGDSTKLSNMDFNAIVNFERIGDTNNIEHALTNGGFSNLDDFCEYIVIKFNL